MIRYLIVILLTSLISVHANALVHIDITRGNVDPLPVAIPVPASTDAQADSIGADIVSVITKDLERSGLFRMIPERAYIQELSASSDIPSFPDWRQINASVLFSGDINMVDGNNFRIQFRLWDVLAEQQLAGRSFSTNIQNWRRIAHLIADEIYSRVTGEKGYFDTRIVYVSESGSGLKRIKRLAIMDQDGANHRFITDGDYMALTPRFSPSAQEVIFMSYKGKVPKVYTLNVDTLKQTLVGDFPGMSFAPRFSPDGKSLVMSVSLSGNSEIYEVDMRTKRKTRLTHDKAIDTSPSYSPDGKQIVFNSDRGGSQQLYTMNRDGSHVRRISFSPKGRYGTPVWSPRGDLIAFTKMYRGKFYIGVMRPDGSGERLLTESFLDEGPTWSPNGRVIIFARQERARRGQTSKWSLYSVDLTGYNLREMETPYDGSDPAWSELLP